MVAPAGAPEAMDASCEACAGVTSMMVPVGGGNGAQGPVWAIAVSAGLQGGGFGVSWAFIARRVASGAIEAERERAAGALPTTQMLSYAIGAALAAIIANGLGLELVTPEARLQSIGFWIFCAFLPLTLPGFRAAWRLAR